MTDIDALIDNLVKNPCAENCVSLVEGLFYALNAEHAKGASLEAEVRRLNRALIYEQHRSGRQGTHGPGCHEWGPQHYECATRELAAERARIAELEAEVERRDEIIACNAGLAGRLLRIEQERDTPARGEPHDKG